MHASPLQVLAVSGVVPISLLVRVSETLLPRSERVRGLDAVENCGSRFGFGTVEDEGVGFVDPPEVGKIVVERFSQAPGIGSGVGDD